MSIFTVASRYAKSFLELSQEQGNIDAVKADMEQIIAIIKANVELQTVLKNPIINTDKKLAILNALFGDKANALTLSFFSILVKKGRADILLPIAEEFIRGYDEQKGVVKATVVSAAALSESNLSDLASKIANEINAQVVLTNTVDPSLIGGFVVRVGDKQVDASISGKLNKLEKYFVNQGV